MIPGPRPNILRRWIWGEAWVFFTSPQAILGLNQIRNHWGQQSESVQGGKGHKFILNFFFLGRKRQDICWEIHVILPIREKPGGPLKCLAARSKEILWEAESIDFKYSQHKKETINYAVTQVFASSWWQSFWKIQMYQIHRLYTLKVHNVTRQGYSNKAGKISLKPSFLKLLHAWISQSLV